MSDTILKVENISKQYRLGAVGTGTVSHDLNRWWHKIRGKEDPYLKIGETNDRSVKANSDYVWALKDINFEVKRGDILGIIGKNGAGKSTLLKILSRVTSPTTGEIKTKGRIASLLEVGTGFHPEMTGRENIYLNGAILGMTKAEIHSKIDEIIAFSGCERYIDTPVKRYSSGMTVRLAFAVAAFLEPDILVVDEVLAVGDAEFQKKAIGKMQDISQGEGRTVLFVSHNMAAVRSLCTKGLVLENGGITFQGSSNHAVKKYLNLTSNEGKEINLSLKSRNDRIGGDKFRYVKVKILNKEGVELNQCISGDYLKIKIFYELKENFDPARFIFGFSFLDSNSSIVTSISSLDSGIRLNSLSSKGFITWEIPSFLLRANRYYLNLFASYNSSRKGDFLDVVEKVALVDVLPGDYWNKGVLNRKGNDMILPSKVY